jgi:hypothetical protein
VSFNEAQHPRAPAGTPKGGEFASKGMGYTFRGLGREATLKVLTKYHLGKELGLEDVARIAGAPPGASVNIGLGEKEVTVSIDIIKDGKSIGQMFRELMLEKKFIKNHSFDMDEDQRGKGYGAHALVQEVRAAAAAGFTHIETYAAGGGPSSTARARLSGANGYYTWARLGFLPTHPIAMKSPSKMGWSRIDMMRMMSTETGRKYWKKHGNSFDANFDLTPGSVSRRVLEGYAKAKGW